MAGAQDHSSEKMSYEAPEIVNVRPLDGKLGARGSGRVQPWGNLGN